MQVTASNPMVRLEGRTALVIHLGGALASHPQFFGERARPGNMLGKFYVLHRGHIFVPQIFIILSPLWHNSFFPSSPTPIPIALTPIVLCGSFPLHIRIGTHDARCPSRHVSCILFVSSLYHPAASPLCPSALFRPLCTYPPPSSPFPNPKAKPTSMM